MSLKSLLFAVVLASFLPGCQPQAGSADQSEAWYLEHRDERKQQLRRCGDNPSLQSGSSCLNAMAAERKSMRSGQQELMH